VQRSVILREAQSFDVALELDGAFGKPREIAVGQMPVVALGKTPGCSDHRLADPISEVAAARMQHHPDAIALVEAKLDEMIAAAKRSYLVPDARVIEPAELLCGSERPIA